MSENRTKVKVDDAPDANGYYTVRFDDGSPHGDTCVQPIATVYNYNNAELIATLINAAKMAPFLKTDY